MTDTPGHLLHYMPIIVRDGGITDWERGFCASMIARAKSARFTPSAKQASIMARIVRAFQERTMRDDSVIEVRMTP